MRCPACGHTFGAEDKNKNRRVCFRCKRPILRHEKYIFVKSRIRHRSCTNPTAYQMDD